jgi:hypothetical protein
MLTYVLLFSYFIIYHSVLRFLLPVHPMELPNMNKSKKYLAFKALHILKISFHGVLHIL